MTWEDCAAAGMTLSEAAAAMGRDVSTGSRYARMNGLSFSKVRMHRTANDAEMSALDGSSEGINRAIRMMHDRGLTWTEIGLVVGLARKTVSDRAARMGLISNRWSAKSRNPVPRAMNTEKPGAPWSEEEIAFIRTNYLTMSDRDMADSLPGRSVAAVKLIRSRNLRLKRETPFPSKKIAPAKRIRHPEKNQRRWALENWNNSNPSLRAEARLIAAMTAGEMQ